VVECKSWWLGDKERKVGSNELVGGKESSMGMEDWDVLLLQEEEEDGGMEDFVREDSLRQLLSIKFSSDSSLLTE